MDFSDEMLEEILKIFQVEAEEIISKINNSLLELEKNPNNKDAILMLFRDAHTLKGASRMVGFNNVQVIAHKMEDVLGLAKENKIVLNSDIVGILYKSVDFLSDVIHKSLNKGQEVYLEDLSKHIELLEGIETSASEVSRQDKEIDFDIELLKQNFDTINNLISDSLIVLMNLEVGKDAELIKDLLDITNNLYLLFQQIGPYDIKKLVEDIKVKLEFITKASNRLTTGETEEIHQILNEIINRLISICEIYNLELVDYYAPVFEKKLLKPKQKELEIEPSLVEPIETELTVEKEETITHEIVQEIPDNLQVCGIYDLECIQNRLTSFSQSGGSLKDIKDFLVHFEQDCIDDNVKSTLHKIIEIIEFGEKNEVKLDDKTISVLLQSIEHCNNILNNKSEIADNDLVLQQLEIIKQVIEFENQADSDNNLITKGKHKSSQTPDFLDLFSSGEIKTLRVDSSKLDTLVNQINELTITKIKTKKHLLELNIINESLQEWQRNSIKVLNYLKYYDKKYFQSGVNDSGISFFIKQLLNLHTDNNKKVQEVRNNIASLHRTIQEDDAKMGLAVGNLEEMIKSVRVLPFATVFQLFGRMVRDIAQEKNKKIELEIIGSETCTDKKIIEEIKAPLIHIIRNSIDHGIETPKERVALGKSPVGKIILSARQVNNKVIIEIEDDGKGINLEKIKNKAVKKGYLTPEELNSMTDEQITNIIFSPGFSTGEEITNISGRGIGLDVVQTKISQLNGKVRVISEVNKGCCVQIELPTTMSTLKAFLVESGNQTFAIPMEAINTVMRKKEEEIIVDKGRRTIIHKEKTIPLHDLSDILRLQKTDLNKTKETILLLENGPQSMALCVDKLLGDQEILHKKLSAPFYKLKNISGITTLISGETCLILNIPDILNAANSSKYISLAKKTKNIQQNQCYKILLVDDSITTRTLEENILTKMEYKVEVAQNPIEAFGKMELSSFDLIISDIEMPEMDGLTFLEKLKSDEMFAEIPIIMMSSLMQEETKKRVMDLGATKYFIKHDFDQEEFLKSVGEILQKGN